MASKDLQLPPALSPTVKPHNTDGLPGFPANDIFGPPGETVLAPVSGTLVYSHMIPWNLQKAVGGETVYLQGDNGKTYFLTHMTGNVPTGRIEAGQPIGQIAAVPQNAWASHVHEGIYQGTFNPPGMSSSPTTPTTTTTQTTTSDSGGQAQGVQGATSYDFTPSQAAFINRFAKDTGIPTPIIEAWAHEEQNNQAAQRYEGMGYNNWLNVGNTDSLVARGGLNRNPVFNNPVTAADATAAWAQGRGPLGSADQGIQDWYKAATGPGATAQSIISGLQGSGWASGGEALLNTLYSHYAGTPSTGGMVTGATGSSGVNGGTKDTGSSVSFKGSGGSVAPPAPYTTARPSVYPGSTYGVPQRPGGQGTKSTAPGTAAILNMLKAAGGKNFPTLTAPNVKVAPVAGAGALGGAGLPTTDLSPFTIAPAPILPAAAAATPVVQNPFQVFGLRP